MTSIQAIAEKVRILVIDDEPFLLQATCRLLREAGYDVLAAETGQAGLNLAREQKPDLVLLDVVLPDLDGLEVCRRIKADATLRGTFVLLFSAKRTQSDDRALGLEDGADGYVTRPISNRELLARVQTLLRLKTAEDGLRASEERYRAVTRLTSDLAYVFRVEPDGTLAHEWMAGSLERIAGYTPEELQALGGWARVIHPDDQEASQRHISTLLAGEPHEYDLRIVTCDGEVRWMHDSGWAEKDPVTGNVARIYGAAKEITERRLAERALSETTSLLEAVLDHTHVLVAYLDPDLNFVRVNRAYAEADDRDPSFFPGKNHFDLYPSKENEEIFRRVVETGQPYMTYARPFEYAEHPERGVSYWDWSLIPIVEDDNRVMGLVLTLAEVTERVQAEQALQESEQRLRTIAANYPAYLSIIERKGQDLVVGFTSGKEFTRRDMDPAAFVGLALEEVFGEQAPTLKAQYLKAFAGEEVSFELFVDDEYQLYNAVPLPGESGEIERILAVVENITERRCAEERLQWELSVDVALAALYEPLISPYSTIEEIAHAVLQQARALTGSAHGYVSSIDPVTGDSISHTLTQMMQGNCKVTGPDQRAVFYRGIDGRFPGLSGHALNTGESFYTNSPESHPAAQGVPDGHVPVDRFLSVPVMLGDEIVGQIALGNPGRDYTDRDLAAIQRIGESYALAIQRKRAEGALRDSEEQYRDLVESISDVIYTLDPEGTITYISPAVESMLGYTPAEVVGQPFTYFVAPEDLERIQSSFRQLTSGQWPSPNEYQVVTKSGDVRWIRTSSQPIVTGDTVTGVRGVLTDVTDRKRTEAQLEQAAAAAERERLARDLHDAVTQTLFSAAAIAEALPRIWQRDPDSATQGLQELRLLTQGALAEMRTMLLELRPSSLTEKELGTLLRQLADAMMGRTRIPVTVTVQGEQALTDDVQIGLYRIAQEALNNIVKHARASHAYVSLECETGQVTLSIRDDGRGFDPTGGEPHQLGLSIMRERARAIGAELTLESEPELGTEITITWPASGKD